MAKRYCLNGSNRFISVDSEFIVTVFEEGNPEKSATFTPERWAQFVLIFDELSENVQKLTDGRSYIKYRHHLGGRWYVSVTTGFQCVDIRQFYWHREKGPSPSKRGIALRLSEWTSLAELLSHLHLQHPELATAEPCDAGADHYNQVQSLYYKLKFTRFLILSNYNRRDLNDYLKSQTTYLL